MKSTHRVSFLNAHIDNVDYAEVARIIQQHVQTREPGYMVSLNTDIVVRLDEDDAFRQAYDAADLALMDSQPLLVLARKSGISVREKLSGSDLMPRVCETAAQMGWRCFFLGGREGVPQAAANNLTRRYPKLIVCGTLSPAYGFEKDDRAIEEVVSVVHEARPDIMFICLGTPKSEKLLHPRIQEFGVPFTLSVGAAIDFCAGNVSRAPRWMQAAGLEWFYRFCQEPRRLFKRYFIDSWKVLRIMRTSGKGVADAHRD